MASTRAKARAMRAFCNIGITAFEELNPDDIDAEPATLNQISLIMQLAAELNIQVNCNDLDKNSASKLIDELAEKNSEVKDISLERGVYLLYMFPFTACLVATRMMY